MVATRRRQAATTEQRSLLRLSAEVAPPPPKSVQTSAVDSASAVPPVAPVDSPAEVAEERPARDNDGGVCKAGISVVPSSAPPPPATSVTCAPSVPPVNTGTHSQSVDQLSTKIDVLQHLLTSGLMELRTTLDSILRSQQRLHSSAPLPAAPRSSSISSADGDRLPPSVRLPPMKQPTMPPAIEPTEAVPTPRASSGEQVPPSHAPQEPSSSLTSEQLARSRANREAALAKRGGSLGGTAASSATPTVAPSLFPAATRSSFQPASTARLADAPPAIQPTSTLSESQQARVEANKEAAKRRRDSREEARQSQLPNASGSASLPPEVLKELGPDPKLARRAGLARAGDAPGSSGASTCTHHAFAFGTAGGGFAKDPRPFKPPSSLPPALKK